MSGQYPTINNLAHIALHDAFAILHEDLQVKRDRAFAAATHREAAARRRRAERAKLALAILLVGGAVCLALLCSLLRWRAGVRWS